MSTFILRGTNNRRNEGLFKIQSCRQKVPLVFFEDNSQGSIQDREKCEHLYLPQINRTENLLTKKRSQNQAADKENSLAPRLFRPHLDHSKRRHPLTHMQKRITTDLKDALGCANKIYHNFVSKKKNPRKNHMSRIIQKVISENIDPWQWQAGRSQARDTSQLFSCLPLRGQTNIYSIYDPLNHRR